MVNSVEHFSALLMRREVDDNALDDWAALACEGHNGYAHACRIVHTLVKRGHGDGGTGEDREYRIENASAFVARNVRDAWRQMYGRENWERARDRAQNSLR